MLSFRQIFAALPIQQGFECIRPQAAEQYGEPLPLDVDLLSRVSGGKKEGDDIPGGGW